MNISPNAPTRPALYRGDCLEEMDRIPAGSVDAIIADLPYGTTACSWDTVIPFEPLWVHFKRVLKERGAVVLFGSEPFSSLLRVSNLDWYKYDWIWDKRSPSDPMNVKIKPMNQHENISVFGNGKITYNYQLREDVTIPFGKVGQRVTTVYGASGDDYKIGIGYPLSILRYARPNNLSGGGLHPTQKPLALLEYLVKTYTNPGDTVLDCTMGSGTTGSACGRLNRRFIGIEKDEGYFEIAENRIKNAYGDFVRTPEEVKRGQMALFEVESVL